MSLKSTFAKPYAKRVTAAVMRRAMEPVATQRKVLQGLLRKGVKTAFGMDHGLA